MAEGRQMEDQEPIVEVCATRLHRTLGLASLDEYETRVLSNNDIKPVHGQYPDYLYSRGRATGLNRRVKLSLAPAYQHLTFLGT